MLSLCLFNFSTKTLPYVNDLSEMVHRSTAHAKECIGCRCTVKYIEQQSRRFNTEDDPLREALGSAIQSHSQRVEEILNSLKENNVKFEYRDEAMAYEPSLVVGEAGIVIMDEEASIGAWEHEYKHFVDDKNDGYLGFRVFEDSAKCIQREAEAYQIEIDIAEQIGRMDLKERLIKLRDKEIRKYQ